MIVLTVHEFAHGLAAFLLGDRTAKHDGRLSLNPLRHVDWFGLLALLVFQFGWAKPVMVDPRNFKNPKVDMALTSAAGPIMNILFAFIMLLVYVPFTVNFGYSGIGSWFSELFFSCATMSLGLGFFNMLPIPPLDGSKIFGALLPDRLYFKYTQMGNIGMLVLLAMLYLNVVDRIIGPLVNLAFTAMMNTAASIFL